MSKSKVLVYCLFKLELRLGQRAPREERQAASRKGHRYARLGMFQVLFTIPGIYQLDPIRQLDY